MEPNEDPSSQRPADKDLKRQGKLAKYAEFLKYGGINIRSIETYLKYIIIAFIGWLYLTFCILRDGELIIFNVKACYPLAFIFYISLFTLPMLTLSKRIKAHGTIAGLLSIGLDAIFIILIWSSKNGHPVKRLLPKKNFSQKHLGFYNPKMNGDGDCYKTFQYT